MNRRDPLLSKNLWTQMLKCMCDRFWFVGSWAKFNAVWYMV